MQKNILDEIVETIPKYFNLPQRDVRTILRHCLSSWLVNELDFAPYLLIKAPTWGHGKSRLMDISAWLCPNGHDPIMLVEPSDSSIYTEIEAAKEEKRIPCLFLDELGRMYNGKRDTSRMTAIMDAGFERGRTVPRTTFENGKRK